MTAGASNQPPRIAPVRDGIARPLWSVMVPVRDRLDHLEQCLRSVLDQAPPTDEMQIEVVDNSRSDRTVSEFVRRMAGARVGYFKQPTDRGMVDNWNDCIGRAHGTLVHILHDDDYVAKDFYSEIAGLLRKDNEVSLCGTRYFFMDNDGIIDSVSRRVDEMVTPLRSIASLSYEAPFQCAGVVIRRSFYERSGGFRPDLVYAPDWEMWARATATGSAIAVNKPLAYYRVHKNAESNTLARTAQTLRDLQRLEGHLSRLGSGFDRDLFRQRIVNQAINQIRHFTGMGDRLAADASLAVLYEVGSWKDIARFQLRRVITKSVTQ